MTPFAAAGSQKWIQIAINRHPEVLDSVLQKARAIDGGVSVRWHSPLQSDRFKEYRDQAALNLAGLKHLPGRALKEFWPSRGPVWDAIGTASDGTPIFLEAKAHIPEAASPACRATPSSMKLIQQSLAGARAAYAPRATSDWHALFYQYANRLAFQYLLRRLNGVHSSLVFLYFLNDTKMRGPASEAEWRGAIRLIDASLGLPASLEHEGVFDAFMDVRKLT